MTQHDMTNANPNDAIVCVPVEPAGINPAGDPSSAGGLAQRPWWVGRALSDPSCAPGLPWHTGSSYTSLATMGFDEGVNY